jgi:hypothetical protein
MSCSSLTFPPTVKGVSGIPMEASAPSVDLLTKLPCKALLQLLVFVVEPFRALE